MRKRSLTLLLGGGLVAAALGAAVNAPAEVLANLEFFSDLELLSNLEILEDEGAGGLISASTASASACGVAAVSSAPAVSTAAFAAAGVKKSTFTRRPYEDR